MYIKTKLKITQKKFLFLKHCKTAKILEEHDISFQGFSEEPIRKILRFHGDLFSRMTLFQIFRGEIFFRMSKKMIFFNSDNFHEEVFYPLKRASMGLL